MTIFLQTSGFASQDSAGGPTAPDVGEIDLVQADDEPCRICRGRFTSGKWFKPFSRSIRLAALLAAFFPDFVFNYLLCYRSHLLASFRQVSSKDNCPEHSGWTLLSSGLSTPFPDKGRPSQARHHLRTNRQIILSEDGKEKRKMNLKHLIKIITN